MDVARQVVELLLSSLLPGTVLSVGMWLLLRVVPRLNAATKYLIWYVTLLVVVTLPLMTYLLPDLRKPVSPAASVSLQETLQPLATLPRDEAATTAVPPLTNKVIPTSIFAATLPATSTSSARESLDWSPLLATWRPPTELIWFLFSAWLTGILVFSLRLIRGYIYLEKLKQTSKLVEDNALTSILACRRQSLLKRSRYISVPMVAGLRHPAILLPESLDRELTKAELENIILHETAHLIRFYDWTKLFQKILQTIFFFHPASYLIGHQLDLEREVASDAWVITERGRRPAVYAKSLIKLFEHTLDTGRSTASPMAGGAVMAKTQIERRINMLFDENRFFSSRIARVRLVSTIVALTVAAVVLSQVLPGVSLSNAAASPPSLTFFARIEW